MKNSNFYNLTLFEQICLLLSGIFKFFLFLFFLQYPFHADNLIITIVCLVCCVVFIGNYIANHKINEKIGFLLEQNENYEKLLNKYIDTITKDKE